MSDRETRMMARMRREDEARRARRDQITTYGLGAVIITFIGAHYTNHRNLERACLALLGAFGLYAVGVRGSVPIASTNIASTPSPRRESTTHRSRSRP